MVGNSGRPRGAVAYDIRTLLQALAAGITRLDKSLSPSDTLQRLRQHEYTLSDSIYIFHFLLASFWLAMMPGYPIKLAIPLIFGTLLLIPLTSQFFLPAIPVLAWVLTFYASRFIPVEWRPDISVSLLPTLESVLYGANISDVLTRFTHPVLDIVAWIPYGVAHFTIPFVVAAFLWLFRTKEALQLWARTFGYMNLIGVIIQILIPCAAPWYELIHGLTPANYSMKGSPGGLARIDSLFHSHGYTVAFSNAPVVFGAFPSLHAGHATLEALFVSHFFPQMTRFMWCYAGVLYWATMYLTHHYLIDVVGGACLATASFYFFLPDELKGAGASAPPGSLSGRAPRNKYEQYDLETPRYPRGGARGMMADAADFELSDPSDQESDGEEMDITYRSPRPEAPTPVSAVPLVRQQDSRGAAKGHRHTASIASLIRGDERAPDEGWSPRAAAFVVPPQMTKNDSPPK
ncbi:hypothetical protein HGRIS_010968 [Hohenbuehelia grisea]|uniref:Phosphatidic acid phosphatase type 2/haloperoxidase domain-containing protein n=1 Tax=Hohenbuehelia grisea TaxID=104357 RepID=A0ABR3IYS5_9AGAR